MGRVMRDLQLLPVVVFPPLRGADFQSFPPLGGVDFVEDPPQHTQIPSFRMLLEGRRV